jgi:hypothetical protein
MIANHKSLNWWHPPHLFHGKFALCCLSCTPVYETILSVFNAYILLFFVFLLVSCTPCNFCPILCCQPALKLLVQLPYNNARLSYLS